MMNNECCVPIREKDETITQMSQELSGVLDEILNELTSLRALLKSDVPASAESQKPIPDCLYANTKINLQSARKLLGEVRTIRDFM